MPDKQKQKGDLQIHVVANVMFTKANGYPICHCTHKIIYMIRTEVNKIKITQKDDNALLICKIYLESWFAFVRV